MLHVDTPSLREFNALNAMRSDACVSIYLPTTPLTQDIEVPRITFGNLVGRAFQQLQESGFDKRRLAMLGEQLDDLAEDDEFWRLQANSLAVLATPDRLQTFRLANRTSELAEVSDRFHLKPLMRAITFPHAAFVLAFSENDVRLVEAFPDLPAERVRVPDLPRDAAGALGRSTLNDRSPKRRITGSEGQKVRLTQFARMVDAAIRPVLAGKDVPLVLAATEPLASIFRSVSSHPGLLPATVTATNDRSSDAELAAAARPVLDAAYAAELAELAALFEQRSGEGRTTNDVAQAAQAATHGAIATLLVDMDEVVPGTIDETTGEVSLVREPGAASYDVIDEIMGRALTSGARILAARRDDIPGGGALAAILRYAL